MHTQQQWVIWSIRTAHSAAAHKRLHLRSRALEVQRTPVIVDDDVTARAETTAATPRLHQAVSQTQASLAAAGRHLYRCSSCTINHQLYMWPTARDPQSMDRGGEEATRRTCLRCCMICHGETGLKPGLKPGLNPPHLHAPMVARARAIVL